MGNFCKQYGLSPIAPSGEKGRKMIKVIAIKNIKNTKTTLLNLMISMLRKMFLKDIINKDLVKVNALTVVNLDTLVKIVRKNLVS